MTDLHPRQSSSDQKADQAFRLLRAAGEVHRLAHAIEEALASLAAADKPTDLSLDVPALKDREMLLDHEARQLLAEADAT